MRARNPWIYAGFAVLALVLASVWWVRRGSDSPRVPGHHVAPDGGTHRGEVRGPDATTRRPARNIPPQRRELEAQARDDAWAPTTEATLRDQLGSAMPDDVAITEVVCKTTACEVTFEAIDLTEALVQITERASYPPEVTDIVLGAIEPGTRQRVRVIVNVER